jgi:hypothetical protein
MAEACGSRNDKHINKACALNALQPPTPANRNKRNSLRINPKPELGDLPPVLGYAPTPLRDWIRLLGNSSYCSRVASGNGLANYPIPPPVVRNQ